MNETGYPTPPAEPPMQLSASHKALAGLLAFLVLAKLIEMAVHVPFHTPQQIAVFSWKSVIFFAAIALLGSGFAHIVGFPGMWEKRVSNRGRIWLPLFIGIVLGVGLLVIDRATGFGHIFAMTFGVSSLSLPFGYSVLYQLYASVCTSILYYLFALAFTVWFIGTLLLSRHWATQVFWILAVLVSLLEPWNIASRNHWALLRLAPAPAGIIAVLALIYVMDFAAVVLFRRFGFTAALILRISAIAVWHIIGKV